MQILIIGIILYVFFKIRKRYLKNIRQKKLIQNREEDFQKLKLAFLELENKRKDEAERKRLDELKYENPIVVFASIDQNKEPSAILKRSDNTYITIKRVGNNFEPFKIGEKFRYLIETTNKWNWYNETEYKKQRALKEKQALLHHKAEQLEKQQSEYLQSFNIEYLYHMTHKSNLQNILQNGLLSHNLARNDCLIQVDIADNQVNNRRSRVEPIFKKSIHDYVPLYFNPKNPMLYRRGNIQNDIIILAIDRDLLYQPNTVFTNGNAASGATSFYSKPKDLENLNWSCINAEYWNDIPDGKRIKCSEVLVFSTIPTKAIKKIFCKNQDSKQFVESCLTNQNTIIVELKSKLYFGGVGLKNNDYQNKTPPTNYSSYDHNDDLIF